VTEKIPPTDDPRCGSHAGYQAHRRRGEYACDKCRTGKREHDRRYYQATQVDRERRLENQRARRRADPAEARAQERRWRLKSKYGITVAEWKALHASQGYACAICGMSEPPRWTTDHDHLTGKVRGILCDHCNRGLGCFYDQPELLKSAIAYLRK